VGPMLLRQAVRRSLGGKDCRTASRGWPGGTRAAARGRGGACSGPVRASARRTAMGARAAGEGRQAARDAEVGGEQQACLP